jgi:dTDP-4-amino-4,6-dideoxygalactose transaminase
MIKFLDLQKINEEYTEAFHVKLDDLLNSGWVLMGNHLKNFETNFANYCQAKHCIGVANGLDAITIILEAHKIAGKLKEGDEVIVPSNTYVATILGILNAGLKPVFIEPGEDFNLSVDNTAKAISPKTKAIFTVHLYGQASNIPELLKLAKEHDLLLFDDAAQAHGARDLDGKIVGGSTNATAFSFYPGKNLGAMGDGGAITTNDTEIAEIIKAYRNYGSHQKYHNKYKGVNSRLDELQAAFLDEKLKNLDRDNSNRQKVAQHYLDKIQNPYVELPHIHDIHKHAFHLFVLRIKDNKRDDFQQHLLYQGIQTVIHYPIPPHHQLALKQYKHLKLPIAEQLHQEVISIPISQVITQEEIKYIIKTINDYR